MSHVPRPTGHPALLLKPVRTNRSGVGVVEPLSLYRLNEDPSSAYASSRLSPIQPALTLVSSI
eukprot:scaffold101296_cov28-Tisochrysis_lutea.AAC.2